MSLVVKHQISLFVPFQPFTTAQESIKHAFELFFPRGYFPGTVQEQVPGIPVADRMSLVNNTTGVNVHFLSNRIDFLVMPFIGPNTGLTLAQFCEEVRSLTATIFAAHDVTVDRLAIISERMIDGLASEAMDQVRQRFIAPGLDGFDESVNIEWSARQVVRAPLTADDATLCNHIYSVSRGTAQFAYPTGARTFEALQVALDINTHPLPGVAFDVEGVTKFIGNGLIAHDNLLSKVERRIHER